MRKWLVPASTTVFFLWGAIHVLGGLAMLAAADDPGQYLGMVATAAPETASLVPPPGSPALAVLPYHAWNIAWIGALVAGIALALNRRNSRAGYWINLALVSGADIGLLAFFVLPGVMAPATASPGLLLWAPAAVFGGLALRAGGEA